MKKWHISASVAGSKYLGVIEAETQDEAEKKALNMNAAGISLCHQCASECEDAEVTDVYASPADDDDEVTETIDEEEGA